MNKQPIFLERLLNAPISKVWQAITNKDEMKKWYFDLPDFKAEIGFTFQFLSGEETGTRYLHLCEVTEVIIGKKLTYSWRYEGYQGNSFVTFELFEQGDKTLLQLTHKGVDTFDPTEPDFAKNDFVQGWTHIINTALVNYLG
jgi:uncharacterized protein YndB with AHSA1/START domain